MKQLNHFRNPAKIGQWCLGVLLMGCFTACYSDREVEAVGQRMTWYNDHFAVGPQQDPLLLTTLSERLDSLQLFQQLLSQVDTHTISRAGKEQRRLLQRQMAQEWEKWAPYRTDPSLYNLGGWLKQGLLTPHAKRHAAIKKLLEGSELYYQNAQRNLDVADASLYRLAAQKQYLALELLSKELPDSLYVLQLSPKEQAALDEKIDRARRAIKDYLAYCESRFLNDRDRTLYVDQAQQRAEMERRK